MSQYGIIYRIEFTNCERDINGNDVPQIVRIDILDTSCVVADSATVTVISLEPAGDPLHTSSIDNSEDKFTPIRATQATIKFLSSPNFSLATFTETGFFTTTVGDPRYYVDIYTYDAVNIKNYPIFKGWLVLDDCSQDFMPHPNVVTLTANDGLGTLRDVPLSLIVTNNPPYYRIADYLASALLQTGLSLPLNVLFNIREYNNPTHHMFHKCLIRDWSYKNEDETYISAYSVIEKILGEEAILTQRCGQWWIVRVDEYEDGNFYRARFDHLGAFTGFDSGNTYYDHFILKESEMFFSQEATQVYPVREHEHITLINKFETPPIPCNKDFSRGTVITSTSTEETLIPECWTNTHSPFKPGNTSPAATNQAYIKKVLQDGYEKERYLVMPTTSSGTDFLESDWFPIQEKDKLNVYIDFRWDTDQGGSNSVNLASIMYVTLKGDDDTNWHLIETGEWVSSGSGSTWSPLNGIGTSWNTNDLDETEWRTIGADSNPAPVDGKIRIAVISIGNVAGTVDDHDMWYQNLSVEYVPLLNGSYRKYEELDSKIYRGISYKAKREKDVGMTDGIKPLFKHSIFRDDGANYVLTNEFFNWKVAQTTTPDPSLVHPYLHIQSFDVWNQYRNCMKKFHVNVQGLYSHLYDNNGDLYYPSPIHRFNLQDPTYDTLNRYFMLLTFDIDWFTCEWTGTMAEVYNSTKGKTYTDAKEVKYV